MKQLLALIIACIFLSPVFAQNAAPPANTPIDLFNRIIGSAYTGNDGYRVLGRICDEAGGRLMGSSNMKKAASILKEELERIGCSVRFEEFSAPGWERGDDHVTVLTPFRRPLYCAALGYTDSKPAFTSDLVFCGQGYDTDFSGIDVTGKTVLVTQETVNGKGAPLRYEVLDFAGARGAAAVLFINSKLGGHFLQGTGNFHGDPTPVPGYSITFEDGKWLQRLLVQNIIPKVEIKTESHCFFITDNNVVVRFPGETDTTIVIGAHYDSWDLGLGGVDNGHGTAVLFEVARLLQQFSPKNRYTIELVWFSGEELGLWGSRKYAKRHTNEPIKAMINMDMPGTPTGFNVMGFDEFIPVCTELLSTLNGFELKSGVASIPYTNSDHMHFMFEGIPVLSLMGNLDDEQVDYYHALGDSFDKVKKKYFSEAGAVMTVLVYTLANRTDVISHRRSPEEMQVILEKGGLVDRLKRQKEWPY